MKDADYKIPGFQASANPEAGHTRVSDFSQLIKTRLTFLVLITTGVGFYLGSSDSVDVVRLLNVATRLTPPRSVALERRSFDRRLTARPRRARAPVASALLARSSIS